MSDIIVIKIDENSAQAAADSAAAAALAKPIETITPADVPEGTGVRSWNAVAPGPYPNCGGVVIPEGCFAIIRRDAAGAFSFTKTDIARQAHVRNVQHVLLAGASVNKTGQYIYTLTGNVAFYHGNGKYAIITPGVYDVSDAGKCLVVSNVDKNTEYDGSTSPILIPVYKNFTEINENDIVLIHRGYTDDVQSVWDSLLQNKFPAKPSVMVASPINKEVSFNFTNNSVTIYAGTQFIENIETLNNYLTTTDQVVDLSSSIYSWYLFFNKTTSSVEAYAYTDVVTPVKLTDKNLLLFAMTSNVYKAVNIEGAYKKDGYLFGIAVAENASLYDKVVDRAIYTNKLFVFDDEPLLIYKESLFVDITSSKKCNVSILSTTQKGLQRLDVQNPTLINSSSLGLTAEIIIEQTDDKNITVKKTINVQKANKLSKIGLSRNILMFGDSLTQGNNTIVSSPIYQVKNRIEALGMVANMVGSFNIETQAADSIGNYRGEGRGFWQYLNFVGMGNSPYGQLITPKLTGGGTLKFQNPFLRLATNSDYTLRPTWCFRNTGVQNELSYQSDPIKTGNFYIFDFANYLTVQNVPTPDIITIALGTNDWQESLSNDLNKSVLACEIMVTKIREALPGVKILIVPANALSISRIEWNTHFAILAEKIITKIETLFSADSNIHTLPLFAHSSRWASVQTATSQGVISVDNNFTAYTVSPDVHSIDNFTGEGMESYMDALLPAIVYCY